MKLGEWFKHFKLDKITLNTKFANFEIVFDQSDQDAAWELYVEMLTRIVTQPLPLEAGDEKTALDSIYALFPTTRGVLRRQGRGTIQFSKVAVPVLNQIVRPFTAKWHRESLRGSFEDPQMRQEFRQDLTSLQDDLRKYNRLLAEIAGVEDMTDLEVAEYER